MVLTRPDDTTPLRDSLARKQKPPRVGSEPRPDHAKLSFRQRSTLGRMGQRTAGDLMFEAYLAEQGYGRVPHEPDLGVGKFPDYVIERNDDRCVVEIKEFAPGSGPFPTDQGYLSLDSETLLKPIRGQLREAARKFKSMDNLGLPLVAMLTNPSGVTLDLSVENPSRTSSTPCTARSRHGDRQQQRRHCGGSGLARELVFWRVGEGQREREPCRSEAAGDRGGRSREEHDDVVIAAPAVEPVGPC